MARPASVDDYLAAQPEATRQVLADMRAAILRSMPQVQEVIAYQIPAYRLPGRGVVIYFAGWKKHVSIYPATGGLQEALADELAGYQVSKGTIRFPLSRPVPMELIERIAAFRAAEAI